MFFKNSILDLHLFTFTVKSKKTFILKKPSNCSLDKIPKFFIDKPFLGYRENQSSITSNISIKNYNDMMKVFLCINTNNNIQKKILKIRVARSICYFKNFLKIKDKNYNKIKESISKLDLPISVLLKLKVPDLLYFKFNLFYEFIDKMRFLLRSK